MHFGPFEGSGVQYRLVIYSFTVCSSYGSFIVKNLIVASFVGIFLIYVSTSIPFSK